MKTIQVTDKKGELAGMKIVGPGQELMLISEAGVVIRVKAEDISKLGRSTQGVKVMNVAGADHVCAIARVSAAKKKRSKSKTPDGQGVLVGEDGPSVEGLEPEDEREAEAELLASEEFEDAEEGAVAESDEE